MSDLSNSNCSSMKDIVSNCLRVIILESVSALDWVGCTIQNIYCEQMGVFKASFLAMPEPFSME